MTKDYRTSQIQVQQIVVSSSVAEQGQLLIYPIDKQDSSTPNQGIIDATKFPTGSFGSDVFLAVSGAVGGKGGGTKTIVAFGGDLHVSGNLTVDGTNDLNGMLTGSVEFVPVSANPGVITTNTLYQDDGTNYDTGSLVWTNKAVITGETSIGPPGTEQGDITLLGASFDAILKVNDFGGGRDALIIGHRHSTTDGANLLLVRSNTDDETHGTLTSGQETGNIIFGGWSGSSYQQTALIRSNVTGTISATAMPGRLDFLTTPSGSIVPTLAARLESNANFTFGNVNSNLEQKINKVNTTGSEVVEGFSYNLTGSTGYDIDFSIVVNTSASMKKFRRNVGGFGFGTSGIAENTVFITVPDVSSSSGAASFDISIAMSSNNIKLYCSGVASTPANWVVKTEIVKV